MSASGEIAGTPTRAGAFDFKITAKNVSGPVVKDYTVAIKGAPVEVAGLTPLARLTNLTSLNVGQHQLTDVSALAGLTAITDLGVALNPIADVSALAPLFSARTVEYAVTVVGPVDLGGTPLTGTVGTPYKHRFTPGGEPDDPEVSLSKGTLPAGLTLTATGELAGTPTKAGTYTFELTAVNPSGSVVKSFTVEVKEKATEVTPPGTKNPPGTKTPPATKPPVIPTTHTRGGLANTGGGGVALGAGIAALLLGSGSGAFALARRRRVGQ